MSLPFSIAAMPASQAMSEYSRLYPYARGCRLDKQDANLFAGLSDLLSKRLSLEVVTPEGINADLHAQLVGADKVHDFGVDSLDNLKTYRLGSFDSNKSALALVNPHGENGRNILAAIYIYWQNDGGSAIQDPRYLRGNVAEILRQKIFPDAADTTQAAIFYSISTFNVMKGAGEMLIERMHEFLLQKLEASVVFSTLSPLRDFGQWIADVRGTSHALDNARQTDVTLREAALEFLLNNRDGVQRFHMGNGATIGDINLNANTGDSKDAKLGCNVMVNYLYSRDPNEIAANRTRYKHAFAAYHNGRVEEARAILFCMMAPHLREEVLQSRHAPRLGPGLPPRAP